MNTVNDMLSRALGKGDSQLSEYESKRILSAYGVPVTREEVVTRLDEARSAAAEIGYPVVLKACAAQIAHKTETGLIALNLRNDADLADAFDRMQKKTANLSSDFLVQEMIRGERELVMGMTRDPQFGPCVMFGLGGIFTEAVGDVVFRAAPLSAQDAFEMMQEIRGHKILSQFRGLPAVNTDVLCKCLTALGRIGTEHERIREIDINPLIVRRSDPVAVDALIVLESR